MRIENKLKINWSTSHLVSYIVIVGILLVTGCNNNVEKVSNSPIDAKSVGVQFPTELINSQKKPGASLTVALVVDKGAAQELPIINNGAWIDREELKLPDATDISYVLQVYYTDIPEGTQEKILVAEGRYTGKDTRIKFGTPNYPLYLEPYDINGNQETALDKDQDKASNLKEILAGGNPNNPGPTFISPTEVKVPERQKPLGGQEGYVVYTAIALSPRNESITYTITGGAQQARFNIDINTGELAFIGDWPAYNTVDSNANNYEVIISGKDEQLTNNQIVTITLTDTFNMTVTVGQKSLIFNWLSYPGASYYKLLENPDGQSGYTQVAGSNDIPTLTYTQTIAIYLFDHVNARYLLQAYDNKGTAAPTDDEILATSAELSITQDLLDAIVYVKASNTGAGDSFGNSVSLSGDGNILAVGAPWEDGAIGAVYVYSRVASGDWGSTPVYIKASNSEEGDNFGGSVSLSGDGNTLAVGARNEGSGATKVGGNPVHNCNAVPTVNCVSHSGAVYVYSRVADDWGNTPAVYIKASNTGAYDDFGSSVSLSSDGNTLAVGAVYESGSAQGLDGNGTGNNEQNDDCATTKVNCAVFSGAVYVYSRVAGDWGNTPVVYIKASNSEEGEFFGWSVTLSRDGNTLAVAAPYEDSGVRGLDGNGLGIDKQTDDCRLTDGSPNLDATNCADASGAVYVYSRVAGDWGNTPVYIKASNTGANDLFGRSVSLSSDGNTLVVGAPWESSIAHGLDGNGLGIDKQTDDCRLADGSPNLEATNCADASGAVYVYSRVASDWGNTPVYIKASNTGAYDLFGWSVSISSDGNTLAVGAQQEGGVAYGLDGNGSGIDKQTDDCRLADGLANPDAKNCTISSGAVYVYSRVAGGDWGNTPMYIKASNTGANDLFGSSVSLSSHGNTLAVGAPDEDSLAVGGVQTDDCILPTGKINLDAKNCARDSGAVYLY